MKSRQLRESTYAVCVLYLSFCLAGCVLPSSSSVPTRTAPISGCVADRESTFESTFGEVPPPCVACLHPTCHNHLGRTLPSASAAELHAQAVACERKGYPTCVDLYFAAVVKAWGELETAQPQDATLDLVSESLYQASCAKLLATAVQFKRVEFPVGMHVHHDGQDILVPFSFHGFVWKPEDFNQLTVVGDYTPEELLHAYRSIGRGVPLVVERIRSHDEPLFKRRQLFAATAVICPQGETPTSNASFTVALYDPLRTATVEWNGVQRQLCHDISAPYAYNAATNPRRGWTGFLQPGQTTNDAGLFMLEPYQPGKIPIVFVHGFLSAPQTWLALANEIQARPELRERYQLWGFEYPTGQPFVTSAADLREELQSARIALNPTGNDPALDRMILIGHSMGGLVSKLQISSSGTHLWDAVADRPFDQVVADDWTEMRLARAFFFEPLPFVERVVYIGTPHGGSALASRLIGRVGSLLVETPEQLQTSHQQLISQNPGVFSREMRRRVPTSLDLLRPQSPLLQAINELPVAAHVSSHSIIGTGYFMPLSGMSDGVVPVSSARQVESETEFYEHECHTELHRSQEAVDEVLCILRRHLEARNNIASFR